MIPPAPFPPLAGERGCFLRVFWAAAKPPPKKPIILLPLPAPRSGVGRGQGGGAKFSHLREWFLQTLLFPGYFLNFHQPSARGGFVTATKFQI